ncbi:hypothetical protein MASR2M17_07890 [Aminivibrio sp.]
MLRRGMRSSFLPGGEPHVLSYLGQIASRPRGTVLRMRHPEDAGLKPGETVLDLGCGAGADLLLASEAVGPAGRVIGVDMTEEMPGRKGEPSRGRMSSGRVSEDLL